MATTKIQKPSGEVDKFEESVSQALLEIEHAKTDIRTTLRELYITGAKELDVGAKKAVVIYVPVRQIRGYQKIQVNLVRELEKKFSGKTVVFLGWRRILPKPKKNQRTRQKQLRPRSRTLTAVHDAILDDLVYPAEIVGKRTRVKLDGTKLLKVHLDRSQQTNIEHKVTVFAGVYKQLTGKDVTFEFPVMD